jgi:cytochrome c oxidase subunit 1
MILPAMGMVSDILTVFARKPLFGYRPMVYSIAGIAGLGFIVWGHHMFMSGMNPALGITFMVSTMMIALPSAVKTFNWLGTLWGGRIQYTTSMLFAISFVSMFIIGGLSGIFMAATPVDIFIHDTYFIVAHFHYVLFAGTAMGVWAGIYFWFPKMFGRTMNEFWGKVHFFLTFIFLNGTFFTMHILGAVGFPRRLADAYHYETFHHLQPLNAFMTYCAIGMVASQVIFAANFIYSMFWGPKAGRNPWNANTLEWTAPSPPGHGNFDFQPVVHRGPYEYSVPGVDKDHLMQTDPPNEAAARAAAAAH